MYKLTLISSTEVSGSSEFQIRVLCAVRKTQPIIIGQNFFNNPYCYNSYMVSNKTWSMERGDLLKGSDWSESRCRDIVDLQYASVKCKSTVVIMQRARIKKNGTKPLKPQNWGAGMWFYCPLLNKSSGNQFIYGVLGIKIGNG